MNDFQAEGTIPRLAGRSFLRRHVLEIQTKALYC